MRGFLAGIFFCALALGLIFTFAPHPKPVPPPVIYDVSFFVPSVGPITVSVPSRGFQIQDSCFISTNPETVVICNLLKVNVCTEDCTPHPAKPEEKKSEKDPAPALMSPSDNKVAENGR